MIQSAARKPEPDQPAVGAANDVARPAYERVLAPFEERSDGEPFEPNRAGLALRVGDVAQAVGEVRTAGGRVIGIEDSGVCTMGFVEDPDGNVLILHRRYAPRVRRG